MWKDQNMIHIITAFTRENNKELMINHLKGKNIKWTVLINKNIEFPDWVNIIQVIDKNKSCYSRFNEYFDMGLLEDETQYIFLNDDDFVEDGFWEKIPNNFDIVFISMKRGNHTFSHGHCTLIAKKENIFCGNVGLEQYIVKGKILKNYRFTMDYAADGLLAEKLVKLESKVFLPDVYVHFNYLEDGRWDSFKR